MFKNYLKVSLRFLVRNKLFSTINIIGLAIGMAATILILLWVIDEISFDRFHQNYKMIYRIISVRNLAGDIEDNARTPNPLGFESMSKFSEIKNYFRYQSVEGWPLKTKNRSTIEEVLACAESSIFDVLSFEFIYGDKLTAFSAPNSIVITDEMAKRFFGKTDVIGEVITLFENFELVVTGVISKIPENSHIMFDCIIPISNFELYWHQDPMEWDSGMFYTYIQVKKKTNPEILSENIFKNFETQLNKHNIEGIKLQELKDIHLRSENIKQDLDNYHIGNKSLVYLFIVIAVGILILACINFINLSLASSINRLKEINVRKLLGSNKNQLIFQFISESLLISFIAHVVAMFTIELFITSFNQLTNKQLVIDYTNPILLLIIIFIILMTGIVAGLFPVLFLSQSYKNQSFSGLISNVSKSNKPSLRKILIVFQFGISSILIVSSLFVYKQISYAENKDLGYNYKDIIRLFRTRTFTQNFNTKKAIFLNYPGVKNITSSSSIFNLEEGQEDITWEGKEPNSSYLIYPFRLDCEFIKTYGVKIIEGRDFSEDYRADSSNYILNETAIKSMNLKDPIGKRISFQGNQGQIIGIVKDFHQTSLHDPIRPMIFFINHDVPIISIKINSENRDKTLKFIEDKWYEFAGEDMPFRHDFVEDVIANSYNNDKRVATFLKYFTVLSIFIALMGLLGLSILSIKQKTKEIGIRKVNGANTFNIITKLIRSYFVLVSIGFILSVPISYYFVHKWLNSFEYKTEFSFWIYLLVLIGLFIMTILVVGISTYKTSNSNPIDSLRYE